MTAMEPAGRRAEMTRFVLRLSGQACRELPTAGRLHGFFWIEAAGPALSLNSRRAGMPVLLRVVDRCDYIAIATAISAARRALFSTSAMLVRRLRPSVMW